MVGVLKVEGLSDNISAGELRRYFRENGARPEDIHINKEQRDVIAFLIFTDQQETEVGLLADGTLFKGRRLAVRASHPKEFNRYFPGVAMITKRDMKVGKPEQLVVKVEGVDSRLNIGDIRKYFKDNGANPVDIHVSSPKGRSSYEPAIAFLIYTTRRDAEISLRADGTFLRNQRLSVRSSSPFEFDKVFPGKALISPPIPKKEIPRGIPGVIKVDNIDFNAKPGDVRRYFKDNGARPDNIHFIRGPSGRHHEGSALLIFSDKKNMNFALMANGTFFLNRKLSVRSSTPKEFNRFFPGVDMFETKQENILPVEFGRGRSQSDFGRERSQRENYQDNPPVRDNRARSRSPLSRGKDERSQPQFFNNFVAPPVEDNSEPLANVDVDTFLRMSGLPYDVSATQIVNYFQPIPIREIFILKHFAGKFKGQTNGSAIVEFFAKNTARRAVQEFDGRIMNQSQINVGYASKEEICRALQIPYNTEPQPPIPGPSTEPAVGNVQMQNLLNLLTATVSAIAGQQPQLPLADEPMGPPRRDDSVVNRVASSANINVNDIRRGCVVGMRNLPYSVTPDEIMKFFDGYRIIPNSIRIHFLDNGKCSGDAIVSFHGNREARNAVSALNRKTIGRRRVELFFL